MNGFFDFFTEDTYTESNINLMDPNEILSPSYSVKDLIPTNTGANNQPPRSMEQSLKKLADVLEKIKSQIGPFNISSAYRSPAVNEAVGGSPTSRHSYAEAADITPKTMNAEKFWGAILLNSVLKESLGHIAWKPTTYNTIHLTLPFTRSSGEYIQGVAQVTQKIAGVEKYLTASTTQIKTAQNKYLGVPGPSGESAIMLAGFNWATAGFGILGLTILGMAIRKKMKG